MMTSFKQEFPAEPSPAGQSGCFEPFEFENYVNFDQTGVPTPSISPLSSRSKSVSTPTSSTSGSNTLIPVQQNPQVFAGPSHEYNLYRQQAGFAVGALANTFAVNQADQLDYGRQSYDMMLPPTDGYFGGTNTTSDFLDFNTVPSQNSSGDMDMDYGSPTNMNTLNSSYIDPATIGGQEITPRAQPAQIHPGRVYPGMHQQAALAKAQAEAKQQTMAQQQRQAASHSRQASRNGSSAKSADPFVDESISRLLNQMRHSSVASSHDDDDDAATPNANDSSYRSRKDEEDMDEDERLLASEEGKKLSSKERRQLRNKVSARAFRSRRKEYIGQLEGEINAKSNECDDLRRKNEDFKTENTRLTDLTQMLLSSPHFRPFLDELSRNGASASIPLPSQTRPQSQASGPSPQGSNRRKDVNPNQVTPRQSQSNMHVGLTMIPEEPSFDFTTIDSVNTGYTNGMEFGGLYDAQVYAVTTLPQGPAVDIPTFAMLHGKSSNVVGPCPSPDDRTKDETVVVDTIPAAKFNMPVPIETPSEDVTVDVSDAALALFANHSSPYLSASPTLGPEDRILGGMGLEKAFSRLELIVDDGRNDTAEISLAVLERFERLCSRCDAISLSVANCTSHLS